MVVIDNMDDPANASRAMLESTLCKMFQLAPNLLVVATSRLKLPLTGEKLRRLQRLGCDCRPEVYWNCDSPTCVLLAINCQMVSARCSLYRISNEPEDDGWVSYPARFCTLRRILLGNILVLNMLSHVVDHGKVYQKLLGVLLVILV